MTTVIYNDQANGDEEAEGRVEYAFLRRATRYLKPEGVLVHIIPQQRLKKAAEHLAHYYRDIRVFRFPYPEYHYFRQIVIFATRRKGYTPDQETVRRLKDLAGGGPEALPPLPCPTFTELEGLLKAVNMPLSGEDEKEREILCKTGNLETAERVKPFTITVPAGKVRDRVLFRSGIYEPQAALAEARRQGVWSNRNLLEEVVGIQELGQVRPLLPMREGQLALLTAAGLLDNTVLEDKEGHRVLVRGSLHKESGCSKI